MIRSTAAQFRTSEIMMAAFLLLRGFVPERREEENGRGILIFEKTADLSAAIEDFHDRCSICGVCFAEAANAVAEARRQLIDGKIGKR